MSAGIGDRISAWTESVAQAWKDRLRGWLVGVLSFGLEAFADIMAASYAKKYSALITKMEVAGTLPPEIASLMAEMKAPTGESAAGMLASLAGGVNRGIIESFLGPFLNPYRYELNNLFNKQELEDTSEHLPPSQLVQILMRRGHPETIVKLPDEDFYYQMRTIGFNKTQADLFRTLFQVFFPSEVIGPIWLRDKAKYEKYWDDVRALGITEDRIELLKEAQYKMPSPQDVVTWLAREVFEPDMIAKYGLDEEWGGLDKSLFDKIGLKEDHALNYWRAHWEHASWNQITDMLHRKLITEEDVWDWFRLVEIPPYWRDNLIKTAYMPYTRVDARRMWDMGVLDDAGILKSYTDIGYDAEHAANMVTWTKVYQRAPQIIARFKNGYINSEDVKTEFKALGLTDAQAQWLYESKVAKEKDARTVKEKDVTKAEIVKWYRLNPDKRDDAITLLTKMGYDADEASFILSINTAIPSTAFTEQQKTEIDTTRRKARRGTISYTQEIGDLVAIGVSASLATAYADNDQQRLPAAVKPSAPEELTRSDIITYYKRNPDKRDQALALLVKKGFSTEDAGFLLDISTTQPVEALTDEQVVAIDTIRRRARQQLLTYDDEIASLREIGLGAGLATAFADNDAERLLTEAAPVSEALTLEQLTMIDTVRRYTRSGLIGYGQEVLELRSLGVTPEIALAYAENDQARLAAKVAKTGPAPIVSADVIKFYQRNSDKRSEALNYMSEIGINMIAAESLLKLE